MIFNLGCRSTARTPGLGPGDSGSNPGTPAIDWEIWGGAAILDYYIHRLDYFIERYSVGNIVRRHYPRIDAQPVPNGAGSASGPVSQVYNHGAFEY